jgi:hypothetical protein
MAYSEVTIKDGSGNRINFNNDGSIVNNSDKITIETVSVGLTATQIIGANMNRKFVWFNNKGTSGIWLADGASVRAGASAYNFGELGAGSNRDMVGYGGAVWGIIAGVSGDVQYMAVSDVG